ncbi:MAG: hypothetical protein ACE5Q6_04365 [Dehalococcoidia bacterium]
MIPVVLLHGAVGRWDEIIFLSLLVAFLLSLIWRVLGKRIGSRKRDQ